VSPFFPWSRQPSPPWAGAEGASPAASSWTPRRGLRPAAPPASSGTQLSPAGQSALKAHLLTALQSDPPKPIAKKVCDAISELAALLLPPPPGVDLLPLAFPSGDASPVCPPHPAP